MKKNWIQIVPLALCVVLLAAVFWQGRNADSLRQQQIKQTAALEEQRQQIDSLKEQLSALRTEIPLGPLLKDWSVFAADVDTDRREITLSISVTAAEGREIAVTGVMAHRPGIEPGENEQWPRGYDFDQLTDGSWSGSLTLPYEENSPVTLTLIYGENGQQYSDALGTFASMRELLPVRVERNSGEMGYNMSGDGRMYLAHRSVELANGAAAQEAVFRLVKNGETALEAPAEATKDAWVYSGYPLEMMGGLPCGPGDRVELHFACMDRFGLSYDFILHTWEINSAGKATERWPEAGTLTVAWPE